MREVKRATLLALGLSDPGQDLLWNQANGYERNVANDIALYLIAQGDFLTDDAMNFGSALSILGGSGQVLNSVRINAQWTMATAGTAEDIAGCGNLSWVFDGRPVEFYTTPLATSKDVASAGLIQLRVMRQSDGALQQTFYRQQETALGGQIQPHKAELGPLLAWPSDGVPFVVGQTYSIKLGMTCGAGSKASTNGNTQPFTFGVRAC